MPRLAAIADCIDRIIAVIGRIAAWGVLVVVLVEFTVVLLRYGFGIGSIWLQETVVYAHAALFMLAAAWTLAAGGHVRVDIFYARTSARHKAWVDLLGTAFFLLPFMAGAAVSFAPLCRALVGDPGAFARNQRPAVGVRAQDADPDVRGADAAARRFACNPRGADARRRAALMGPSELLAIAMVVVLCALLMAGYPVALTLGGVALGFAFAGHWSGVMDLALLGALPARVFGVMSNEVLIAIPLFVFMGVMLERSGLAEDLLETMGRLFGARAGRACDRGRARWASCSPPPRGSWARPSSPWA